MPKLAKNLNIKQVEALKQDGRHAVGGVAGLHLLVSGEGRSWIMRIKIGNRRTDIGLGSCSDVSLGKAREVAHEIRLKVRDGIDPLAEKREAKTAAIAERAKSKTFEDCATAYIEANKAGWKSEKHAKQWGATLDRYAYPTVGKLPVSEIGTAHILNVIEPIWATKTETASRLRGRIESILDWAKVREYRDGENPARWRGHLDKLLPNRSKVQKIKHHAALPYADIGEFMAELRNRNGLSSRALEFAILTASRSGEVRGATWSEIDIVGKVWNIPADRMKAGKDQRVPLSEAVVALLEALPRINGTDFLFPAVKGGQLSDMALSQLMKRMKRAETVHGFRSTFRDWAGETTAYPREVIEHALAHKLKDKAEAAYQRGDMLTKRARLMADWSTYCATVAKSGTNVVAIKGAA